MRDVLIEVNKIFIDVFEDDSIVIKNETTANDIEEWDSLTHIQLILAIEKHFKFRFTSVEIQTWKNVGEMLQSVEKKLEAV